MSFLSKDQILAADDRESQEVDVPEWGGKVMIRSLTGRERDQFEASTIDQKTGRSSYDNFRAKLVALCVVDEEGRRLFTSKGDVQMLGNKSVSALQRVFNAAAELNGMSQKDVDDLTEDFGVEGDEPDTSD